jgi:hypothetical protein
MALYTISNKIINDPVYGLIPIPGGVAFEIVNHPWFQRLSRIRQLGLTHYVYPGAIHTRFQHTLGCVYLMQQALDVLESKGVDITPNEAESAVLAILMHDIGHGPFSHALENLLVTDMCHEDISILALNELNGQFDGALETAGKIFNNQYHKHFLHQLVSSQLDTDRLDYLNRDSFFTGVSEGVVSTDRIIKMLNVNNDRLVVDQKGIYSIEKFLIARRLMYWQVYLHKTVISAEQMLRNVITRAKELVTQGETLFSPPALGFFLNTIKKIDNQSFEHFAAIDDDDILSSIKVWGTHKDKVLSYLSQSLQNRKLFRIKFSNHPFDDENVKRLRVKACKKIGIDINDAHYLVYTDVLSNSAYRPLDEEILILMKTGEVQSILYASDMFNHDVMSKTVLKYYLCYPKEIDD